MVNAINISSILNLPLGFSVSVFFICLTILISLIIIIKTKTKISVSRQGADIEPNKLNNLEPNIEKIDRTKDYFFTEKVDDCRIEINKKEIELKNKQFELLTTYLLFIEDVIMQSYKKELKKYCKKYDIKIEFDILNSRPYLKYKELASETTKKSIISANNSIKDNSLWKYSFQEYQEYKETKLKKYMKENRDFFINNYNAPICILPADYHEEFVMPPTENKIKEIIDEMQDKLRENSVNIHNEIFKIEKKLNSYKKFQDIQEKMNE